MKSIGIRAFSVLMLLVALAGMYFVCIPSARAAYKAALAASRSKNAKIDSYESVMNYPYDNETTGKKNILLLKNLDFGFVEQLSIPGMPDTKEKDFKNQWIYSASQCPQGICFTDDFVLLTSYSDEADCLGELMVFDRKDHTYLVTLGMDSKSHLGGITFDGTNVWVCNSEKDTLERISYDFIKLMAQMNPHEVVDATQVVDVYEVKNTPSCVTYYEGRLFVATHTLYFNSKVVVYYLDQEEDQLQKLSEYSIPPKVQGIAFSDEGRVYLSTSYGRKLSSYLLQYESIYKMSAHPGKPVLRVELPPGSEEVDIEKGTIYMLFESAGEKYVNGTDGKGKSVSPIDKILTIPEKTLTIDHGK